MLSAEQIATTISAATKSVKTQSSQTPFWLKAILGTFAIYVVVVIVFEMQHLPSGNVQKNQPPIVPQQTDPSVVNRISDLEKQIAANPNDAEPVLQLANELHDAKFFPRAIETYKKYIALNPKNVDARVDLGICYFEVGNHDQAVKEIESVITAEPKHQMAMFNLGIIQLSIQNIDEAKQWLKKCVEIDPQSTAGLRALQILQQH